jgi:catecholate siderophore receptor
VPYNQVSLWNKYQIDPVWAAALGVIYFSDSFASSDDSVRLPGFVRFDAAVYAKINEMWRVQLNIENIFNRVIGPPLTATTTSRPASRVRSA